MADHASGSVRVAGTNPNRLSVLRKYGDKRYDQHQQQKAQGGSSQQYAQPTRFAQVWIGRMGFHVSEASIYSCIRLGRLKMSA